MRLQSDLNQEGPVAIMKTVDPALVHRMDLAIFLNDDQALDELFGATPVEEDKNESDVILLAGDSKVMRIEDLRDKQHMVFDTGATAHSMKSKDGARKIRDASGREVVAFDGRASKMEPLPVTPNVAGKAPLGVGGLGSTNVKLSC